MLICLIFLFIPHLNSLRIVPIRTKLDAKWYTNLQIYIVRRFKVLQVKISKRQLSMKKCFKSTLFGIEGEIE